MFATFTKLKLCKNGSAAVEFALTLPCLLLVSIGGITYGYSVATLHSVQQLAAEAARASIPGVSAQERASLAQSFVTNNLGAYPLLDPTKTTVAINDGAAPDFAFSVAVSTDLSNSFVYQFRNLLPLPSPRLTRSAVVRRGGF